MADHSTPTGRPANGAAPIDILLVEDNPLDTRATFNAAQKLNMAGSITVMQNGQAALDYLHTNGAEGPLPGLILLDLNLPGRDGTEVSSIIKDDAALQTIPVVILTSSDDDSDVQRAYDGGANAFITKPSNLDGWLNVISTINDFWLSVARLPPR